MRKILHLSPWLILFIIYIPSLILRILSQSDEFDPLDRATFLLFGSMWIVCCYSIWFWALSFSLLKKLTALNDKSLSALRISFFVPATYLILPIVASFWAFILPVNSLFPFLTFEFFSKLHNLSLISLLYPIYFIAKSLTTLEYRRSTEIREYITTLLLLVIFPLGVFSVQPRLKKIFISQAIIE